MMKQRVSVLVLVAFVLLCVASVLAQEAVPEEKDQGAQVEKGKTIVPSAKRHQREDSHLCFYGLDVAFHHRPGLHPQSQNQRGRQA